jgi:hypothetical protein
MMPCESSLTAAPFARVGCRMPNGAFLDDGATGQDFSGSGRTLEGCQTCSCLSGVASCKIAPCLGPLPPQNVQRGCLLTGAFAPGLQGGGTVADGWSGTNSSLSRCSRCRCANGILTCTLIACENGSTSPSLPYATSTPSGSSSASTPPRISPVVNGSSSVASPSQSPTAVVSTLQPSATPTPGISEQGPIMEKGLGSKAAYSAVSVAAAGCQVRVLLCLAAAALSWLCNGHLYR